MSANANDPDQISHFWISSYPFFECTLLAIPPAIARSSSVAETLQAMNSTQAELYDPDGALLGTLALAAPRSQIGIFELESLLENCKLESGIKHAQLIVRSPAGTRHLCRMHAKESAALLGPPASVTENQAAAFPLTIERGRTNYIFVINQGRETAKVKCRLLVGKRTPELVWTVPGHGSRLFSVENEFKDCWPSVGDGAVQAYLRFNSRGTGQVGVGLLEQFDSGGEHSRFGAVS